MARVRGRASEGPVDVGFQLPPEGPNDYVVCEPIEASENEEKTRTVLKIPFKVVSQDESIDGVPFMMFFTLDGGESWEKRSSEQRMADILSAMRSTDKKTNLIEAYDKKYPNESSWLSPILVETYKTNLPGKYIMFNIKIEKSRKDPNKEQAKVVQIGPQGTGGKDDKAPASKPDKPKAVSKTNIPEDF